MARKTRKKIGEILIEMGVVGTDQVLAAVEEAKSTGKRTGEVLVEQGACKDTDVAKALASQYGAEFLNFERPETLTKVNRGLLKEDMQKKYSVVPMRKEAGRLVICVHDPLEIESFDLIGMMVNARVEIGGVAPRGQIMDFLSGETSGPQFKKQLLTDSLDKTVDRSTDRSADRSTDRSVDRDAVQEAGTVKLIDRMIVEAVTGRASDIHIEPRKDKVIVRFRIDGVCIVRDELPKSMQNQLLARVKLMAGVNIAERRIPQDGRIKMTIEDKTVDFRVSACPAVHGESVVLRILRPDSARIGLEGLGFEADNLANFNRIIRRPNGIFLVTGPTGSGKTTTLYSALNDLNTPDRKIITAEDPVEYAFKGINQVQVREHIGLTFSAILKSMLRQAPNIILVGEIRDREVADIAIQAALTGHMVFSTLHTNDAPSAITRLIDMGVKPFLVASSIQAVMGQRLVRILCEKCKAPDNDPDRKVLRLVNISDEELSRGNLMKPVGCAACNGTGYRGRRAIFELMTMNSEIRDLAFNRATVSKLRSAAIRGGMRSLLGDGKIKILRGMTTPAEIANFAQIEGFSPTEVGAT
ncbi:MAG: GspE/PulE family protein [Phycisphaerales bacterium]